MSATVSAPLSASCAASATPMPAPWRAIPRVTPGSQRRHGAGSRRTAPSSTRATFIWRRTREPAGRRSRISADVRPEQPREHGTVQRHDRPVRRHSRRPQPAIRTGGLQARRVPGNDHAVLRHRRHEPSAQGRVRFRGGLRDDRPSFERLGNAGDRQRHGIQATYYTEQPAQVSPGRPTVCSFRTTSASVPDW